MNLKQIAKDTTKVVISYLTYQAVRTVIDQLSETDPPRSLWLHTFSTKERIQDGELYIRDLFQAEQSLAFRILTVREHLANEVCEFLPEMVRTGILEANIQQRRQQLERMTEFNPVPSQTHPESDPEQSLESGESDS